MAVLKGSSERSQCLLYIEAMTACERMVGNDVKWFEWSLLAAIIVIL